MTWRLVYTAAGKQDAKKLIAAGLDAKARELLRLVSEDPLRSPPPFEKLVGDLAGAHSRRITMQDRLACQFVTDERSVKVLRMRTHVE